MKYGKLVMGKKDYVMILRHRYMDHSIEDYTQKHALETLEENMKEAQVFDLNQMPKDIVRLYSWVTVTSASGWSQHFQLVLPSEIDIDKDRVSVQSTLGASVIGLSEGDLVQFGTPIGLIPLQIEKVEQSGGYVREYISEADLKRFLPKQNNRELILEDYPMIQLEAGGGANFSKNGFRGI